MRRKNLMGLYEKGLQLSGLEAIKSVHKKLSLVDLYLLSKDWNTEETRRLLNEYGHPFSENLKKTFVVFSFLPEEFLFWASEKGLGLKDFAPLRAWDFSAGSTKELTKALKEIASRKSGRHLGVKTVELVVDLLLMGKPVDNLVITEEETLESWCARLEALRYPNRSSKTSKAEADLVTLPWPKGVESRWIQKGDAQGIEVRFFVQSPEDFVSKSEKLLEVSLAAKTKEVLW